jgi:hypothetical protein
MDTRFIKLNDDWNADPNAPVPFVVRSGDDVILEFHLNSFQFKRFQEGDRGRLVFRNCWRYRMGVTNDEGWYLGQCRFSNVAPAWGEFYEVRGDSGWSHHRMTGSWSGQKDIHGTSTFSFTSEIRPLSVTPKPSTR